MLKEVARRISGAIAGEVYAKVKHTKYPSHTLISRIKLFAICLSFSSPPLHPCSSLSTPIAPLTDTESCEINTALLNLVMKDQFAGLPSEMPLPI